MYGRLLCGSIIDNVGYVQVDIWIYCVEIIG